MIYIGQASKNKTPQRQCIVSGEILLKQDLIRFVVDPVGVLTPDINVELPGRGLWVKADYICLSAAIKKNAFARRAKEKITLPDNLIQMIDHLLTSRIIQLISLARKSGEALCGFETVKISLLNNKVSVLLHATDGSPRQIKKLHPPNRKNGYFNCLTQSELGLAFGREYVIHAALTGGGLTKKIRIEASRLIAIRKRDRN